MEVSIVSGRNYPYFKFLTYKCCKFRLNKWKLWASLFPTEIRNNLLRVTLKYTDCVRVPNKYLCFGLSWNVSKFSSCSGNTWSVKDVDEMRALFWQFFLINKTVIIFLNYLTVSVHKYVITCRKMKHKQFITTVFNDCRDTWNLLEEIKISIT